MISLAALLARAETLRADTLGAFRLASAETNAPLLSALTYLDLATSALRTAMRATGPDQKTEGA